jgi:acyl transferase domain-containing protein/acyl carrier protein
VPAPVVTGTLRRGDGGAARLLASLAQVHVRGVAVDWAAVLPAGQRVELPTYAFQHQRYWPSASAPAVTGGDGPGGQDAAAETRFWAAVDGGDVAGLAGALALDERAGLDQVLPALAAWRRQDREESVTGRWRYRFSWVPVPDPGAVMLPGIWLVVVPAGAGGGLADGCLQAMTARGAQVVVVKAGPDEAGRAVLADRIGQALADKDAGAAEVSGVSGVSGVLSLLALEEGQAAGYPVVPNGLAGTVGLVQALGDAGVQAPLWLVTCGAVAAGETEMVGIPVQAMTWGLGLVAGLEHPGRWGGLVDVPPVLDERAGRRLCGVLAGCGEDQVAIRDAGIVARRLVRAPLPGGHNRRWVPRGSVLVTGATGVIGPYLARWLAEQGTPRVVLASRSGPAAPDMAALAAGLAEAGTQVSVMAGDITNRAALSGLLAWIAAGGPPLSAVMHAAVGVDLHPVAEIGMAELAVGLGAKVAGAALLDELTAGASLDAFVLFSSIAGVWGSGLHGSYAAANAYLDALASHRRARGRPATSVAWGVWDAGWVRGQGALPDGLRRQGLVFLDPGRALGMLGQVLAGDETFVAVADVDWARFAPVYRAARAWPLLEEIPEVRALAAASGPGVTVLEGRLAARLVSLATPEQERVVLDLVRVSAAAVLGHESADAIEPDRAFRELGFDSLTAVELRDRLNAATGLKLPSTVVFDYPSATGLARHVLRLVLGVAEALPSVVAAVAPGEPVAVVGLGCRFPGGVRDPEGLWELVAAGRDAISGFPLDRGWDTAALYDPDPDHAGTSYTRQGGFVTGAGDFDAGFFGISPREALAMDPQQRLLLEVCWEAIEQAGISPLSLRGSRTGVFAGAAYSGYDTNLQEAGGTEGYLVTGNATAVISGRVSYSLGLEGPAVTVDTACSSSLVTLHLACQALRAGECDLALAGGVAIMVVPGGLTEFARQRALAADGRCKAFSAAADGMGLAEGAGVVVLERLSDARRNGHEVLAVVRGSAVNQDGASNGLTAPNGPSQQRVIRAALASARVSADQVDAVEGHGTGTTLGDPIEAQALIATYGQDRGADRPLWLGSVKSNIGHPQAAAGVAGVIKMVLALRHGILPRTLHADKPSPHVDWSAGAVRLLAEPVPWPANGRPRRAGVSAFGISGTNAHVILEESPASGGVDGGDGAGEGGADASGEEPVLARGGLAWLVSARTAEGLRAQAGRLSAHVAARPDLNPFDVGWSLATTRSVLEHRAVVLGAGRDELAAGLAAIAAGEPAAGVVTGMAAASGAGRVVFVFPGQGGQWAGMGWELAACCPVFAARLGECSRALAPYVDWSLEDVLAGAAGAPGLERVDVVQPVLWAVMVSLAAAWQAAGVTPDAVAGHSQGEIAAACVAGILSLEDGAKVVALRSRALIALAGRGGMVSVPEPAAAVRERIAAWGDQLAVAAVNGPAATVVCGEPAALAELAAACQTKGVRARPLSVDYASHSGQVETIRDELLAALAGITPGPGQVPMVSAMTGDWLEGPQAGAGYWYDSLRATVEFGRAIQVLAGCGHQVFIEASPHPVLTTAISQTLEETAQAAGAGAEGRIGALVPVVTGTLRRDDGGAGRFLASLAAVHVRGTRMDWAAVLPAGRRVELPTYAFQHRRYWPQPSPVAGGDGSEAAESRFWAAVEDGDVREIAGALAVDERAGLDRVLPALAAWRRREQEESVVAGWRYRVGWVRVADPGPVVLTGRWLVVVPADSDDGLADGCVRALAARGAEVLVVEADQGEADREVLADRVGQVVAGSSGMGEAVGVFGVSGVVSLLGLAEGPLAGFPVVPEGLAGTLGLVQALGDAGIGAPLWVLTCGAVAAGEAGTVASPVQAMVWGLGQVAALEHPERWGGLVDVPAVWDERVAGRLCGVLAGCGEDQVAVRGAGVLARRLMRAPQPRGDGRRWVPGGSVLVTGGTGAVGGQVARWLAGRGAQRVVLTSRSGPEAPGTAALAAGLAGRGTRADVIECDIAERARVAGLLDRIAAGGPPLSTVMHAAGVVRDATVARITVAGLAEVLAAKVAGAVCLDELTVGLGLDAFVLFSSGSATWGSGGLGGYAAANAFLDGLVLVILVLRVG